MVKCFKMLPDNDKISNFAFIISLHYPVKLSFFSECRLELWKGWL